MSDFNQYQLTKPRNRKLDFEACNAILFRAHGESASAIEWLMEEVKRYRTWIEETGEQEDICTYNILGTVCSYCACKRSLK